MIPIRDILLAGILHDVGKIGIPEGIFDAMSSERPYRCSISREKVVEEMQQQAGFQFDPQVVEIF